MKSISSKKPFYKHKKFFLLVLVVVALVAAVSVYAVNNANEQEKNKSTKTSSSVDKDKSSSTSSKKRDKEESYKSVPAEDSQSKDTIQAEDVVPSGPEIEAPNITRAEQTGEFIRVSAILSNPSSGTCILKFEQPGQQAIQTEAPVILGPSYYTCNGFRVPVSQFPSKGQWSVTVTHNLNGKTASSKGTVNVQ